MFSAPPEIVEGHEICVDEDTTVLLYMSADDSTSKASPVVARKLIRDGHTVPASLVRTYEFLNYYTLAYPAAEAGRVRIVPQMVADGTVPGAYVLQIGVQAPHVAARDRRPLNLTFTLDNSGSMRGAPMDNQKAVLRAIAAELEEGDIVSMVSWNTSQNTLLESHWVSGPDDPVLLRVIEELTAGGGTNLNAGLRNGYRLAQDNFDADALNRVVVISDGQANVGVTERETIAAAAQDGEGAAIYLVGVGTGNGYDDRMMDTITDAGKGGYLFVDSPEEAFEQFSGELFVANLDIAAMDVRLRLRLPSTFRVLEFHGEEMSEDAADVKPQHLAPNTAMVYHQSIGSCTGQPFQPEDVVEVTVEFLDPHTREAKLEEVVANGLELLGDGEHGEGRPQLVKGNAVVAYAEGLKRLHGADAQSTAETCELGLLIVEAARQVLADDEDLDEILGLYLAYCQRCLAGDCGPDPLGARWGRDEDRDREDPQGGGGSDAGGGAEAGPPTEDVDVDGVPDGDCENGTCNGPGEGEGEGEAAVGEDGDDTDDGEPPTCAQALDCLLDCDADDAPCTEECRDALPEEDAARLDDLLLCRAEHCAEPLDEEGDARVCLDQLCAAEADACVAPEADEA